MLLASYNAGQGNIQRAVNKCQSNLYESMMRCLPTIIGQRSIQTANYVSRVLTVYN